MATINTQSIAIEEKYSPLYKEVHCTFSVNQFPLANNVDFEIDYQTTTEGGMQPTMWNIKIKFFRDGAEGNIACVYAVKRIDSVLQSIWISFNLEFFNAFWISMGWSRGFTMLEAVNNREIRGLLYPVVNHSDITQLPNQILNVKFCLNIFYVPASQGRNASEAGFREGKDMLKSKL